MRYLVASSTPFPPLSSVVHSFSFLVLHFSLQREKQQRFVTDGETLESICHVSTSVSFAALFSCALAYAARVLSLLLLLNPASRLVLPALRSPPPHHLDSCSPDDLCSPFDEPESGSCASSCMPNTRCVPLGEGEGAFTPWLLLQLLSRGLWHGE